MHKGKLLVLLLIVGALGGLWLLREKDAKESALRAVRLFEGVDPRRVSGLRIDHRLRSVQVKLERDASGRWFLTDPLAYPADAGRAKLLMDVVTAQTGLERPDVALDQVGLDPPVALLEVIERMPDGGERRTAVQLGALDVDSQRCWTRDAEGRVLLTLRTIHDALDLTPDQYRDRGVLAILPHQVYELSRTGAFRFAPGEEPRDLAFTAQIAGDPAEWRAHAPVDARLDPLALTALIGGLSGLRVVDFFDDSLDELSVYGLDDPLLRVEVGSAAGGRQALLLSVLPRERERDDWTVEGAYWLAMREGFPFVWELSARDVRLLASPFENLLDYRLTGGRRDLWTKVELAGAERELELARDGERWSFRTRSIAGDGAGSTEGARSEWGASQPADAGRVEDLLVLLESSELVEWLRDTPFPDGERAGSFAVESRDGERWSGAFGPAHTLGDGRRGRLFRRGDSSATFLAGEELEPLLTVDPSTLASRLVHELDETLVTSLALARDGEVREYARGDDGIWHPAADPEVEARELWELLDRLLALRAERWIEEPVALERPIEVRFTARDGKQTAFTVGLSPTSGEAVLAGERSAALEPGLHGALEALF